jgi:ketosteroid isomerase-like protein
VSPDAADAAAEVEAAFAAYEAALVANDVDQLDEWFWDDERVVRFAFGRVQHGGAEVRAARRAVPRQTPPRRLHRLTVNAFGPDVAVAHAEFEVEDEHDLVLQTQVWARSPDGRWRVAGAHVSKHQNPVTQP